MEEDQNQIITFAIKRARLIKSIHLKHEERLKGIQDKRAIAKRKKLGMTSRRKFEKKIKAVCNKMDEIGTLFPDLSNEK